MAQLDVVDKCGVVDLVDFIKSEDDLFVRRTQFFEYLFSGLDVVLVVGIALVDDMDQKIGDDRFFKGGLESLNETVG